MPEPNSNDQTAMRREAIIRAAGIAVNCYRWQGEGRAHYLADAMENLGEAVDKFEAGRVETAEQIKGADVTVPLTGVEAKTSIGNVGVVRSYDPEHDDEV